MNTFDNALPLTQPSELARSVDQILRDSRGLVARIQANTELPTLAKASIATIFLGAAAFGASLGSYRGGLQILYAGVKLPLVMLLTTAIVAPSLTAINAAFHRESSLQKDIALVLSSLARSCLVLAAFAPLLLLAITRGFEYHSVVLLAVLCCTVAGAVGLGLFMNGMSIAARSGKYAASVLLLLIFSLVGSQMAWTLRPFLVRPRSTETPFLRHIEGSFVDAVLTSQRSARGIYTCPSCQDSEVQP